jgi:hypothetical protein
MSKEVELKITPELVNKTQKLSTEEKRALLLKEQERYDALTPEEQELEKLKAQKAMIDLLERNRIFKEKIRSSGRAVRRGFANKNGRDIDGKEKASTRIKRQLKK